MDLHSTVLDLGQILCCKKNHFDSNKKFSKTDNIKMLEVLIDNIFAMYGRRVVQHMIVIPMGRLHTAVSQEKRKEANMIL